MDRLRYSLLRLNSALLHWARTRLTPAGRLALAGLIVSAVLGIDTTVNVAYQAFALLFALLSLAAASSFFLRIRFEARRGLPRFGSVGIALPYTVNVWNLNRKAQRGLAFFEELPDPRPSFEEFLRAPRPDGLPWYDRAVGFTRWRRLVGRKQNASAQEMALPDIPAQGSCELAAQIVPSRRGRLELTATTVACPDPLGLFRTLSRRPDAQSVLVLPRRYPVAALSLPGRRRYQQGGVASSSCVGDSQEFLSLRDYRPGDPPRRIHWKSWAKTGKPVVKEYQDEYFVRQALVLDTFLQNGDEIVFEEAVSVAASFAASVLTQESLLDLLFVGTQAYCFTAGRGLGGPERMLEILAGVQPCAGKPFSELRQSVVSRHASLSGCLCVLLAWDEPRRAFIREIQALGVPVLAVVIVAPGAAGSLDGARALEVGRIAEGLARL